MYPEFQFESWSLSSYFLIISLDLCFMIFYLMVRAKKFGFPIIPTLDLGIVSILFGFIGARLFHIFYENPLFYRMNPMAIFKVWEGGFVFYGGLLSGQLSGIIILKLKREPLFSYLDLFAPIFALGYSIGRLACFFQGCCYGKQTDSFLGLHFFNLKELGESFTRQPTQLFASVGELTLYFILILIESRKTGSSPALAGKVFTYWLIGHGINRMIMEIYRDDPRGPLLFSMGISFWISILFIVIGLGITLLRLRRPYSLLGK